MAQRDPQQLWTDRGASAPALRGATAPRPEKGAEVSARNLVLTALRRRNPAAPEQSEPLRPAQAPPNDTPLRPDPALLHRLGPRRALGYGLLPWRRVGACTIVLCSRPEEFERRRPWLERHLGPVRPTAVTESQIRDSLAGGCGALLAREAECRAPAGESCRGWSGRRVRKRFALAMAALLAAGLLLPQGTLVGLTVLAILSLAWGTALKCLGAWHLLRDRWTAPEALGQPAGTEVLPTVTLLVPLFREREIARALLRRLERLDYPRHLLDVCLVLEASDPLTRETLEHTSLPGWMRAVIVPAGALQTKPRALNYALTFARGTIVGVYDAEDAPAPDQIRRVTARFAAAPPETACLQGTLDYYNAGANWLSRCFALEYATWFRALLPALDRLGFALPLGGTTLFLRRAALEDLGGWDAHNVTEDADLGIRLARHGYRTELIATVTEEEANARAWPWVRQRSRWLKGYAMTYAVHMRSPRRLWRDLGPRRFLGVQLLFLGALLQFALAPLLWSFWLIAAGLPHPLVGLLPPAALYAAGGLFLLSEAVSLVLAALAARAAGKPRLCFWAPTLHLYFALGTVALYKALAEMAWRPFFWDKTSHGIFVHPGETPLTPSDPPPPRQDAAG